MAITEVDAALRKEVWAVDELDRAALAAAGLRTLGAEIEDALDSCGTATESDAMLEAKLMAHNDIPPWEHDDLVHAYWVVPGRLLAGEYPGAKEPEQAARKIQTLLDAGITSFVDLTRAGERTWGGAPMVPYDDGLPVRYARFAIPDCGVISDAGYDAILAHIRAEIIAGRVVYVHCWGGKGRTGTVVGAWLIDHEGVGYPDVLDRMQELRTGTRKAHERVPDTLEQAEVLRRRAARG